MVQSNTHSTLLETVLEVQSFFIFSIRHTQDEHLNVEPGTCAGRIPYQPSLTHFCPSPAFHLLPVLPLLSPLHARGATGSDKRTRRVTQNRRRKSDGAVALKLRHNAIKTTGPICSNSARSGAALQSVKAGSRPRSQHAATNTRFHRSSGVTDLEGEEGRLKV